MTETSTGWLLDNCLPISGYEHIDAVHIRELSRLPGPAGLVEASNLDRVLVTCAEEFRGPCSLTVDHPGIVIFEIAPVDAPEVERNLRHLEFRIEQYGGSLWLSGSRFLIRPDRTVSRILSDGREVELEPWRQVRMSRVPAGVGL